MAKKMRPDGPPGPPPPGPPPIDALRIWPDWTERLTMGPDMGPGMHQPGMGGHMPLPKIVFASMLGTLLAALVLMAGKKFVCRRRCCQRFHGHNQQEQGLVATGHPVVDGNSAPKASTDYHVMA